VDLGLPHAVGLGQAARGEDRLAAQSFFTTRISVGSWGSPATSKPSARMNLSMSRFSRRLDQTVDYLAKKLG
jgi:hypothetical protein